MVVHVLNHMRHDIVVHRVGCADVTKAMRRRELNSDWFVEVADGQDVAEAVAANLNESFGPGEPAWRADHIKVMPCVRKAK